MRLLLFLSIFTSLAGLVLLIFTVLIGINEKAPFDQLYWSQVKTSKDSTLGVRWTNFGVCEISDNKNSNCTDNQFAFAYDTTYMNVSDSDLDSKKGSIKSISRAGYILLVVAVGFSFLSIPSILMTFILPVSFLIHVSFFCTIVSFILAIVGCALETYVHVYAVTRYLDNGLSAATGSKAFGIAWGAVVALIVTIIFIAITEVQKRKKRRNIHKPGQEKYDSDSTS